jgi:hypothetical protein
MTTASSDVETDAEPAAGGLSPAAPDIGTLIAISSLAYVLAVALHEHAGHSAMCSALGSHTLEMGAFYSNCDAAQLTSAGIRWVAAAGPMISLLTGAMSFWLLTVFQRTSAAGRYFWWLFGAVGLMEAAGYPLFSGASGLGDLGTGADGMLRGAQPAWLWRFLLVAVGVIGYWSVVRYSLARLLPLLRGTGPARIRVARRSALISYVVGAVVYLAIGTVNPYGIEIVLISVLPSSLGGTSGLLWMFSLADRSGVSKGPGLYFDRSWAWIVTGVLVTAVYAAVFGPSLRG